MATQELLTAVVTGIALGSSAGLAPGPLTALLVNQTLRHGRGAGLRMACVPLFSDPPVVLLSVLLLSRLARFAPLLGGISLLGAAFVTYLALDAFRAASPTSQSAAMRPASLSKGVLTNWLNPHPYLFWITVGAPLMLRPGNTAAATAFVTVFYACLVGAKILLALLIARFRDLLAHRWYVRINRLLAMCLLALAALLLSDGVRFLLGG